MNDQSGSLAAQRIKELNEKFSSYEGEYTENERDQGLELIEPHDLHFISMLGEGTSASVYVGTCNGKEVAIKTLKSNITSQLYEDCKKELKVFSVVKGPRVVGFYGVCLRPCFCIVMEYCKRASLMDVLADTKLYWTWDLSFDVSLQVVQTVQELHNWNPQIVHRDLKTLNLLVTEDFKIKVCDFGLSRQTHSDSGDEDEAPLSSINTVSTLYKLRGTWGYSAPELYQKKLCTTKADIFSLGVILWEIWYRTVVGEYMRPYADGHFIADCQILVAVAKRGLRPTVPSQLPAEFKEILRNCWETDPDNRPDCDEILTKLEEIQELYKSNKSAEWDAILPRRKKKKKKKKKKPTGKPTKNSTKAAKNSRTKTTKNSTTKTAKNSTTKKGTIKKKKKRKKRAQE